MNILLIAGHGAGDCGAVGSVGGKTYYEADLTRELVNNVYNNLKLNHNVSKYPFERNFYKDIGNKYFLINKNFDLIIEFHFNASKKAGIDRFIKGTEIYLSNEYDSTLRGIAIDVLRNMGQIGITNRGIKKDSYRTLNYLKSSNIPALLFEVCFIDDQDDLSYYLKHKKNVARAVFDALPTKNFKICIKKNTSIYKKASKTSKKIGTIHEGVFTIIKKTKKKGVLYGMLKSEIGWIVLGSNVEYL